VNGGGLNPERLKLKIYTGLFQNSIRGMPGRHTVCYNNADIFFAPNIMAALAVPEKPIAMIR